MKKSWPQPSPCPKNQQKLDVVGQIAKALTDGAVSRRGAAGMASHGQLFPYHNRSQECGNRRFDPVSIINVITMLGVAESVPLVLNAQALPDPAQQGLWGVPMPVRNLFRVVVRFPFRVVVMVIISMIQALDGHLSLMCPGASYRFAEAATRAPRKIRSALALRRQ